MFFFTSVQTHWIEFLGEIKNFELVFMRQDKTILKKNIITPSIIWVLVFTHYKRFEIKLVWLLWESHSSKILCTLIGYRFEGIQCGIATWKWGCAILYGSNDHSNAHSIANYQIKCVYFCAVLSVSRYQGLYILKVWFCPSLKIPWEARNRCCLKYHQFIVTKINSLCQSLQTNVGLLTTEVQTKFSNRFSAWFRFAGLWQLIWIASWARAIFCNIAHKQKRQCDSRKIHYLTLEFHVKFHLKNRSDDRFFRV